jgi:hypothetical protein
MNKPITLPRTVRGKRPEFFATPGVDEAMSMILVLAQELSVLRDRLDGAERVAANHGIALAAEIDALVPDEAMLSERETWRQAFYDRLFYFARQQRSELEARETKESYRQTLDEIARQD